MTWQVTAKYVNGYQVTITNLPSGTQFQVNGKAASMQNGMLKVDTQTGTGTITMTFPIAGNTNKFGNLKLVKTDGATAQKLAGATYGVYSDAACRTEVTRMKTGSDGTATASGLRIGTYYVKEIQPSAGYALNPKVYTAKVEQDQAITVSATDTAQKISLTLIKTDPDQEPGCLARLFPCIRTRPARKRPQT